MATAILVAVVLATAAACLVLLGKKRGSSQVWTALSGLGMVFALFLCRVAVLTALAPEPPDGHPALEDYNHSHEQLELATGKRTHSENDGTDLGGEASGTGLHDRPQLGSQPAQNGSNPGFWVISGLFARDLWLHMARAWPQDRPHQIFLVAMLLSFLGAFVLYHHFPSEYSNLELGDDLRFHAIHHLVPFSQLLFAMTAILTLENFWVHMVSTLLYLLIFVFWDRMIIGSPPKQDTYKKIRAEEFKKKVSSYLWEIDTPTVVTFSALLIMTALPVFNIGFDGNRAQSFTRAFMAGVVASQAVAAVIGAGRTLVASPGYHDNTPAPSTRQQEAEEADLAEGAIKDEQFEALA